MSTIRHMLITLGFVVGLIAAAGGTAVAATPSAAGDVQLVSYSAPIEPAWNNNDRNRDRDKWNDDSDRKRKGHWNNGWKHRWWKVSAWQCRKGHGHVDWRKGRCWGGRFHGAHIRRW